MKNLVLCVVLISTVSFLHTMDRRTTDQNKNFENTYDQLVKDDFFATFKNKLQKNGNDRADYLKLVDDLYNYSKTKFKVDSIINANNIAEIDDSWSEIKKIIRLNCAEGEELKNAFIHLKQLGETVLGKRLQIEETNPTITELGRIQNNIQKFITKLEHVNGKLRCDTRSSDNGNSSSSSDGLWGKFKSLF